MAGGTGRPVADGAPALRAVTEAIVSQASLGIWVLDADDCTTFVNERMAEIAASTPQQMLGAPVYDLLDPASAEATRSALRRRRTGVSELREIALRRRDGRTLHALVESMPLQDPDGNYTGAVAMVEDITARKQIEREVGLLAALVQASSDAIVACSLDGTVQSWNPAAEELFGWSANEITGRSLGTILAAGAEGVVRLLEAAANGTLVGPLETDDFGTGYSALGYLKCFPFDIVKVDRSFVRGLGQDSGDSAIVGAVLGMARALGMEVVAEGIENETQLACLAELGARYGQGFYFARPGPV